MTKAERLAADYGVTPVMADKAAHLPVRDEGSGFYTVASGSEPGVTYSVRANGADWRTWPCDCVAPGACSHQLAAATHIATAARRAANVEAAAEVGR